MRPLATALLAALALPALPARAADAKAIFEEMCSMCHGETGHADTKLGRKQNIPDFTTPKWQKQFSDEKIKKTIREGIVDTKMQPFKDKLTPAEIDALLKLIRSLK
jgi:mono/diheme cytochrome c family protein